MRSHGLLNVRRRRRRPSANAQSACWLSRSASCRSAPLPEPPACLRVDQTLTEMCSSQTTHYDGKCPGPPTEAVAKPVLQVATGGMVHVHTNWAERRSLQDAGEVKTRAKRHAKGRPADFNDENDDLAFIRGDRHARRRAVAESRDSLLSPSVKRRFLSRTTDMKASHSESLDVFLDSVLSIVDSGTLHVLKVRRSMCRPDRDVTNALCS